MDLKKFEEKISEVLKTESDNELIQDYLKELELMSQELIEVKVDIKDILTKLLNSIGQSDYIHHACEFSLIYHFFKEFPSGFLYQIPSQVASTGNKIDTPKNYDVKFSNNGINFHVEIKTIKPMCYDGKDPIKLFLSKDKIKSLYEQGARNFSPNLMSKISNFLKDANRQLPEKKSFNDVNIVILCCNDLDEYADVLECLGNEQIGILRVKNKNQNSEFVPTKEELFNIDGIVICNLGFEHQAFFNRGKIFKLYQSDDVCLNGKDIWGYKRSIPVLPMLFFTKKFEEDIEKTISCSFFSHTPYFYDYWKNYEQQEALFKLFNDIINKKIK
ncbi:hypothetical protein [Suttonella indologenes]|uniref:Uncharacterized protein n=1 Tax=Suttonella indologenes TaxID=13276 RepID=A0A380N1A0_9GAMM|nr:hypothetical protein [Suttonella indologenes]SUO98318.1 Uncharacterised protein [Suttonella indologenes]